MFTMKVRISNNSVRFRLKQFELTSLREKGFVQETLEFPSAQLHFILEAGKGEEEHLTFSSNEVRCVLPETIVERWISTDQVGIEAVMSRGDNPLKVLIEKD